MSARNKLRNCFPSLPEGESNDLIEAAVDEILDDHARELAAAIRYQARTALLVYEQDAAGWAADLIDPDKEQ